MVLVTKKIITLVISIVVVCVFYYSWIPDSKLGTESYMPRFILNWCNSYYNLRTAIPFFIIGFLFEFVSTLKKRADYSKFRSALINTFFSAILVGAAETGQKFLVRRYPDLNDVLFGISGSIIGAFFFHSIVSFKNYLNGIYSNKKQI
jgi:hypothetical protein